MTGRLPRWPWCQAWAHWVRAYRWWCSVDHVLALAVIVGGRLVELAELLCPSLCVGLGLGTLARPETCLVTDKAMIVWT